MNVGASICPRGGGIRGSARAAGLWLAPAVRTRHNRGDAAITACHADDHVGGAHGVQILDDAAGRVHRGGGRGGGVAPPATRRSQPVQRARASRCLAGATRPRRDPAHRCMPITPLSASL